jgi:archaellum biogenesis protein FlaJ (TadC family)
VGWIGIPVAIAAIIAAGGWLLAAVSALQIFSMVPRGQRWAGYNELSMWRFDKLRQRTGPQADTHIKRMKQGGIAFALALLVLIVIVAINIAFSPPAATAAAALTGPVNGVSDA